VDVTMPQLGETVTEGTITKWLKQVGDQVAVDEPLFEVSTDKVDSEVPSPVAGVLTEIVVPEGDTVDVGARLAVVGDGDAAPAAEAAGLDVVVSAHRYIGNGRALILGEPDGMVKIIAEKRSDGTAGRILGVHMVGPWVTEQLGQGYLAVNWEATVDEVAQFIQPHPTLSELFGESVLALTGRSLHG